MAREKGGNLLEPGIRYVTGDNETDPSQASLFARFADAISSFYGSLLGLALQAILIGAWICLNIYPGTQSFLHDPAPFNILNLVITLENVLLGIFILISNNRAVERDRRILEESRLASYRIEANQEVLLGNQNILRSLFTKMNLVLDNFVVNIDKNVHKDAEELLSFAELASDHIEEHDLLEKG
jgi:uncharacterized membrane protein